MMLFVNLLKYIDTNPDDRETFLQGQIAYRKDALATMDTLRKSMGEKAMPSIRDLSIRIRLELDLLEML